MNKKTSDLKNGNPKQETGGITRIKVASYKSIDKEQSIDIRPLTILAGANSSGKTSIMQPILLLKQTLESTYDPGSILLDGPNVRFTSGEQLFFWPKSGKTIEAFQIGLEVDAGEFLALIFSRQSSKGINLQQTTYGKGDEKTVLRQDMTHEELLNALPSELKAVFNLFAERQGKKINWAVIRDRCFLELALVPIGDEESFLSTRISMVAGVKEHIRQIIHVPGLRGNPERTYPLTAVGSTFPGTFENYTASVIAKWQASKNDGRLEKLSKDLERLGLTWKVTAKSINDTQVELHVGRLPHATKGGAHDLVSIADVGFGVSQMLPVLTALNVAKSGQLVYLEQPEIHLHPRAQTAMAQVLADAAKRGVRVVAETHSALLLLGIQTLVAEGKLPPELVKLHWFTRGEDGATTVRSADLDETGAFGDWPEDFADVELTAQSRYLDAAEARQQIH